MNMRVLFVSACILLTACSATPRLGAAYGGAGANSSVQVAVDGNLPAPERSDLFEQNRPFVIGPFDRLNIEVYGVGELSQKEIQIDAGGRIALPLIGTIEAAGMTPQELARLIEQKLVGQYVRNPQVTINLKETVSQVITVDGEVKEPGLYPVVGRMTLMRAVATAKGTSELAKLQDVVIFRTVKGQKMAALYNLKAIRRGFYDDPEVFANDVVVVGDSTARRIFKDALVVAPLLTTPLILFLQQRN
jgi:polysaccharide export outer membrane protein